MTEGIRFARGLPVYEDPNTGHATLMYGALHPVIVGTLFRVFGPSVFLPRLLSLLATIVVIGLLVSGFFRESSRAFKVFVASLLLGVCGRTSYYYVEPRPDLLAFAVALGGLHFVERSGADGPRRGILRVAGAVVFSAAFLLKQTTAVVALIPLALWAVRVVARRRFIAADGLWAALPILSVLTTFAVIRGFCPLQYHYMFVVPSPERWPISWPLAAKTLWLVLASSPLFLWSCWRLATSESRNDSKIEPLAVSILLLLPACVTMQAKAGGAPNSLLPALLAMTLLSAVCVRHALQYPGDAPGARFLAPSFVALLALLEFLPRLEFQPLWYYRNYRTSPLIVDYRRAIDVVRNLPGAVVCPEEPLVVFEARGSLHRNMVLELDEAGWRFPLPRGVRAEILAADWVVDLEKGRPQDLLPAKVIESLGFQRVEVPGLQRGGYAVFRRLKTATAPPTPACMAKGSERPAHPARTRGEEWTSPL